MHKIFKPLKCSERIIHYIYPLYSIISILALVMAMVMVMVMEVAVEELL